MKLTRLIYYSVRNPSINVNVPKLVESAQGNNKPMNITGVLHHNNNAFLQVLEGNRAEVSSVYHRINSDSRHMNIILIGCNEVKERMFPDWSMALHEGMNDRTRGVFLRYFGDTLIDPNTVGVDALLLVLQELSFEATHNLTGETD